MNFPPPGQNVEVRLDVRDVAGGTEWCRRFGGRRVRTVQRLINEHMVECRGPGRLWFRVHATPNEIKYESVRFSVFGIVFPRWMMPRATGRVTPTDTGWQVEIEVRAPIVGLLTGYEAVIELPRSD